MGNKSRYNKPNRFWRSQLVGTRHTSFMQSKSTTPKRHFIKSINILMILAIALILVGFPQAKAQEPAASYQVYLPYVAGTRSPQSFGVNIPYYFTNSSILSYTNPLQAKWAHGATISWARLEPSPGVYDWNQLTLIEHSIGQLRTAGIEPIVIVTDSPAWARKYPEWVCSPPDAVHYDAFARTMHILAKRYASGPTAVNYWEVWNEPDAYRIDIPKHEGGIGCWMEQGQAMESGIQYGQLLYKTAFAIRSGNPNAKVLGGALTYWDSESREKDTLNFLRGMTEENGKYIDAIDMLSFHAYGSGPNEDWLSYKLLNIRKVLRERRLDLEHKAMIATEVGAPCPQGGNVCNTNSSTGVQFINTYQTQYAARIPAINIALRDYLNLQGAIWFPLANQSPGFAESHLIDLNGSSLKARPGYYALNNALSILRGAKYVGAPITITTNANSRKERIYTFKRGNDTILGIWTFQSDFSKDVVITVKADEKATCWSDLGKASPTIRDCTPSDGSTQFNLRASIDPQYVVISKR